MKRDSFSSRIGLVLAALGMAIGTGNIWRFPRIAARWGGEDHGAGAFLLAWLLFLLLWSVPILVAEFTLGKISRRGPIGAFARVLGPGAAWMGGFIVLTTLMIAAYYSVVTGWTLSYLAEALQGFPGLEVPTDAATVKANHARALARFEELAGSEVALGFHLGAAAIGLLVVWRGVRTGVELACKLLIPALFLLLAAGVVWVFSQGVPWQGFNFLFDPHWQDLGQPKLWIDALSQSAWSTGAGWGLILVYGSYARRDEDAVSTNFTAASGNNIASMLSALFIFPAVFTLLGAAGVPYGEIQSALEDAGPGSTGLAFQYVPFIFKAVAGWGTALTILFFVGLFVAALSSFIAMYELGARTFQDLGASRRTAVLVTALIVAGVGAPAALDMDVFVSMDWVWGVALILCGLMVVWAVQMYGVDRYRRRLINATGARKRMGWTFNWLFLFLVPAQGITLLVWYLVHEGTGREDAWDPFALGSYNAGTCVWWWGAGLLVLMLLTPVIGRRSAREHAAGGQPGQDEVTE